MRRLIGLILVGLFATAALHAQQNGNPRTYSPTVNTFMAKRGDVVEIHVDVQAGLKDANPQWEMKRPLFDVMIDRIILAQNKNVTEADNVWKKTAVREPDYRGITVKIQLTGKDTISPFTVFRGAITNSRGKTILTDPGRALEYWLMGTARIKRDQLLAALVLPILSFEQCRLLGNQIVDTTPRQCLLADGNILLETSEQPTNASLKAVDFDSCLKFGKALIKTFPRRCMAAGGRVFTEPPRVYEPPADAPLAAGISNTMVLPDAAVTPTVVIPSAVSVTQPHDEVVGRTGLGRYTIPVSDSALPNLPPAPPEQAPPLPRLPVKAQNDAGQPNLKITSTTLLPGGPRLGIEQPQSVMPPVNPDTQLVPPVTPASKTVVVPGTPEPNRFAPGNLPPLAPRPIVPPTLPQGVEPAPSRGTINSGPASSAVNNAQTGPY